jgi:hypothetical protein
MEASQEVDAAYSVQRIALKRLTLLHKMRSHEREGLTWMTQHLCPSHGNYTAVIMVFVSVKAVRLQTTVFSNDERTKDSVPSSRSHDTLTLIMQSIHFIATSNGCKK